MKRGALYGTVGWARASTLVTGDPDSAREPVHERTMMMAVGRLPTIESPPRYVPTAHDLAQCSEVDRRVAQDSALMACAHSGCAVVKHTPHRPLDAGAM